jgi:eukaryotic-like serine/threonine-protein kinase
MTILKGTRLGPYEIDAQIGAGGMGAVYLAVDSRLERKVAIKILPSLFASDAQFLARFEREAKTISSLSHPNICVLHDVGKADLPSSQVGSGTVSLVNDAPVVHYLVMEYLDGVSLSDRVAKGPLPLHEVLRIGRQVADALDKAHRQGIVHRDLKPGNVMLTKTGAKLLDFGLAKTSGAISDTGLSQATVAKALTQEGTIIGTFQYMSPEQLEGVEADARSDIFALGCVLYEMATGKRAFQGETRTSLIAAIVSGEPQPISELQPLTPPALEHVIRKCLSKDPEDRWQSARDVFLELEWASEAGSHAGLAKAVASVRRTRFRLVAALAVIGWMIAAGLGAWLATRPQAPPSSGAFRASVIPAALPSGDTVISGALSISPDGRKLLYMTGGQRAAMIAVYDFESGTSRVLPGTEVSVFAFWSPDSRWIGFFQAEKLRKIDVTGGPAQTLADAHDGRGGAWNQHGEIIFAPDIEGPLMKVSENGGPVQPVTTVDDPRITHRNPSFLPDGRKFLFVARHSNADPVGRTMLGSLDGSEPREILNPGSNAVYSSGYLLFVRDRNLLAQRFDPDKERLEGTIVPIVEGVSYYNARDVGDFSASSGGLLAYRLQSGISSTISLFDRDGRELQTLGEPMVIGETNLGGVAVSRDLQKVAVSRGDQKQTSWDVWILDIQDDQLSRASFTNSRFAPNVAISPDGESLAVSTLAAGSGGWSSGSLWLQPLSGSRTEKIDRSSSIDSPNFYSSDWSPDARFILGNTQRADSGMDITWIDLHDPQKAMGDLVRTRFEEVNPKFSPNGNWIAYTSDETGRNEIYLIDFPGGTTKRQASRNGGSGAIWSRKGNELFFVSGNDVMAVSIVISKERIELGPPERIGLSKANLGPPFASDGERFVMVKPVGADIPNPIHVVRDWTRTLK